MRHKYTNRKEGGYTLVIALIFFLAATTAVIAGVSDAVFRETRTVKNESLSKQSYYTSESAVEDAAYRLKTGKTVGSTVTLTLASSTAVAQITTDGTGVTEIEAEADASGTKRTTAITLTQSGGISFPYALQAGVGGIDMSGSSQIEGDIYTTGSIRGCSSCSVTGMAVAAGKSTETLDVDNSSPSTLTNTIVFGNSNSTQDIAQSFTVSESLSLIKAQVYIRKTGNPANATIRVVTNNSGSPSSSVLASGTLSSSLVSTSYDWEEITFTANPVLTAGTTYWIVIDANTSASNYYTIGANSTYANGQAKIGRHSNTWNNTTPSGLDAYVKIFIGSNEEGVSGESEWNRLTVGSAYAYKASFVNSTGALYCQVGILNNKACDMSRADPVIEPNPVADSAVSAWKDQADDSVHSGDYTIGGSSSGTLGPKKITGNMNVGASATLRISGTIWVQGNLVIDGSATMLPDATENYAIVVDGTISLGGSARILGSSNSHILLVSTSSADPAVTISGSADDTVVSAPNGGLLVEGSGKVNVAAADHITLTGSAQIEYDPDVSQFDLESGSSGGEFQLKSWKETQ